MPSKKQIENWIENYLNGTISEEEKAALESWYGYLPDKNILWPDDNINSSKELKVKIWSAINVKIEDNKLRKRKTIRKYIMQAAAVMIFTIGAAIIYTYNKKTTKETNNITADIAPGITKAVLTLPNGRKIILDSAHSINATNGSIYVVDKKGTKEYFNDENEQLTSYNTLITQRGEASPPIILNDGTKVWVNSASELHFPLRFNGASREVSLSGEAYFEVAKDHKHPFIVNMGKNKIEVTGTHFDIMAYDDEPYTFATLLEGAISITNNVNHVNLLPGQQGKIDAQGKIVINAEDVEQSIAWLHDQLPMDGIDLSAFMRKVSRWYNVDVIYKGKVPSFNLSGSLDKNVPLSQVLSALNANGIKCELINRSVTVSEK